MRIKFTLTLLLLLMVGIGPARAQLLFTLNPAGQSGLPGQTITFNATLTNDGLSEVFLNGDHGSLSIPGLLLDDSPFFNDFPLSLPSSAVATGDLFQVSIASNVAPGVYTGTFTVVGGADDAAQDDLASQNFQVTVAAAPEPGTIALVLPVLLGGLFIGRRGIRRR